MRMKFIEFDSCTDGAEPDKQGWRAISGMMVEMNYIAALDKRPVAQAYAGLSLRVVLE